MLKTTIPETMTLLWWFLLPEKYLLFERFKTIFSPCDFDIAYGGFLMPEKYLLFERINKNLSL